MKYAELDGVIYRTQNVGGIEKWADKLEDGKWVKNPNHFRVNQQASVIDEDEAREIAGDQWPGKDSEHS